MSNKRKTKKGDTLLVDGDILVYRAMITAEKEVEWEPDLWVMWCDLRDAKDKFKSMYQTIKDQAYGAEPFLCFSDYAGNFRKSLDGTYKGNRTVRKPMAFHEFRAWTREEFDYLELPTLEADDIIGMLATKTDNDDTIIWSIDKDLRQIPGRHMIDDEIVYISEAQADHTFYMQVLTGDAVDNYPGCPGIGKVTAEKILNAEGDTWTKIVSTYEAKGLNEADALLQARLARILRWSDWDNEKQEVKLWTPNADTATPM